MKQTVDITIFHFDGKDYIKRKCNKCFWEEDQATNIKKSGLSSIDSLYVSIPYFQAEDLTVFKGKDLIVQGNIEELIDNTSQQTQASSIKQIKASHEVFTINSVSRKCNGSKRMWHWELSGK